MEVVGYCAIKKDATTGVGDKMETFLGQTCRVMEFASDGGVMVMNREATAIATFDKQDLHSKFECSVENDVVCPPNLEFVEKMMYVSKVMTRKGGYHPLLKQMVIEASLHKGRFNDNLLWQMQ